MHGPARPPRTVGPALPGACAWTLLPWRSWRRALLVTLAVLVSAAAWLQLGEPGAEALAFTRAVSRAAAVPASAPAPALGSAALAAAVEVPPAIAAGAELLVGRLHLFDGEASYYAPGFEGRPTASGEPYRALELTAAHRTLPFGTRVKVTNLANGRSVVVRINDRGPFHRRRVIDLSRAAAERLAMVRRGRVPVEVRVVAEDGLGGDLLADARR